MTLNPADSIAALEMAWSEPDGFLFQLREGRFDPVQGNEFLKALDRISPFEGTMIDRRLVSLLWFIPLFVSWQKERVAIGAGDRTAFEKFASAVENRLQKLLGVP